MTTTTKTRICKKRIGRPLNFSFGPAHQPINGVVEKVRNGIATIRYYIVRDLQGELVASSVEGFTAYLSCRSEAILEVF